MPPTKTVLACIAVLLGGTAATFVLPCVLDLWGTDARGVILAIALITLAAFVVVARRTLPRPYLRRQTVIAAAAAPFATALVLGAVLFGLELAGADCPRSGMDYISECNDLAAAGLIVFFVGIYVVGMLVVMAAGVLLAAAVQRTRAARRRGGSGPAAGDLR